MGVRSCDRNNCDNIMCENYIPNVGYLCNSCKDEFLYKKLVDGEYSMNRDLLIKEINDFLKTPRGTYDKLNCVSICEFFEKCKE